jgi:hypothetical protein
MSRIERDIDSRLSYEKLCLLQEINYQLYCFAGPLTIHYTVPLVLLLAMAAATVAVVTAVATTA